MIEIDDITDYIISQIKSEEKRVSLINLKIQKLLYYIQAWSYGINQGPLFNGEFQAWIHGPINVHIFERFSASKTLYSEINLTDRIKDNIELPDEIAEFVDFILENYVKFSGAELEQLIQEDLPWLKTRGHLGKNEKSTDVIEPELLRNYYGKLWKELQTQ